MDKLDSGELSAATFEQYHGACDRLIEHFGEYRRLDDLRPEEFRPLRKKLAKGRSIVTLRNNVNLIRVVLKFAYDEGVVDRPIRFGQSFDRPSKKNLRGGAATTLARSCNRHRIDPLAYLEDVYTRLPMMTEAELPSLLPDIWIKDHPHLLTSVFRKRSTALAGLARSEPGDGPCVPVGASAMLSGHRIAEACEGVSMTSREILVELLPQERDVMLQCILTPEVRDQL